MNRLIYAFLLLVLSASTSAAQSLTEQSLWKNGDGSLLLITKVDVAQGKFGGTFVNYAKQFRLCEGVGVPVYGTISGNTITMVGSFATCSFAITVWKGTVNGTTMTTTFEGRYVDEKQNFQQVKGSDTFKQQ